VIRSTRGGRRRRRNSSSAIPDHASRSDPRRERYGGFVYMLTGPNGVPQKTGSSAKNKGIAELLYPYIFAAWLRLDMSEYGAAPTRSSSFDGGCLDAEGVITERAHSRGNRSPRRPLRRSEIPRRKAHPFGAQPLLQAIRTKGTPYRCRRQLRRGFRPNLRFVISPRTSAATSRRGAAAGVDRPPRNCGDGKRRVEGRAEILLRPPMAPSNRIDSNRSPSGRSSARVAIQGRRRGEKELGKKLLSPGAASPIGTSSWRRPGGSSSSTRRGFDERQAVSRRDRRTETRRAPAPSPRRYLEDQTQKSDSRLEARRTFVPLAAVGDGR